MVRIIHLLQANLLITSVMREEFVEVADNDVVWPETVSEYPSLKDIRGEPVEVADNDVVWPEIVSNHDRSI
jgi:hypothetical protein